MPFQDFYSDEMAKFKLSYYRLAGNKIVRCKDVREWGAWFGDHWQERVVGRTVVGALRVSTVFSGFDLCPWKDDGPYLFETMIFDDIDDTYQKRCRTYAEAVAMHEEAVQRARHIVAEADKCLTSNSSPSGTDRI